MSQELNGSGRAAQGRVDDLLAGLARETPEEALLRKRREHGRQVQKDLLALAAVILHPYLLPGETRFAPSALRILANELRGRADDIETLVRLHEEPQP